MITNLVPSKFADWLETLPKDMQMGEVNRCRTCPIASYLNYLGYNYASVGPWDLNVGPDIYDTVYHNLPSWAITFIKRYDRTGNYTAGEALRIMKGMRNA